MEDNYDDSAALAKRPASEQEDSDEPTPQKRTGGGENDADSISVRFLISNGNAGSVIGKGGATITEFQTQSGARIQLSRTREFFPGTTDRILLLSGSINSILTALHLLLSKIKADTAEAEPDNTSTAKIVVPNACCGAIIGKGGANIRSYCEDSKATIKMSSADQQVPGVADRVVTITGTVDSVLRAVALITTRLSEEPAYPKTIVRPFTYSNLTGGMLAGGMPALAFGGAPTLSLVAPGMLGLTQAIGSPLTVGGAGVTTVVAVPDEHIGAIIGRSGQTIADLQRVTGVSIKVSGRDDMVPGTQNRKVTLTGPGAESVQIAQYMLSKKIKESAEESSRRRERAGA